jgi:hypothetical protein
MIPEAVAMEMATVEAEPIAPAAAVTEGAGPKLETTTIPEVRLETRSNPLPRTSTDVVVSEPVIEEAASIRSAPMSETTSTSRKGLKLLDDNLINPANVSQSMESWRRTEKWIMVRCEHPE